MISGTGLKTVTASATTTNMINLTHEKFGYLETSLYSYNSSVDNISVLEIESTGSVSGSFVIDKVEFIPITGSVEEYDVNQTLKKARKVVNVLYSDTGKKNNKG
ncbi:hypothetical protein BK714_00855 [Bacillus thuringiensis serovar oswaldocruzi]|nr:hypothetical protein BK714_00855 [Bacillus thuringiensis serovar oswaldocruzi]